jgi:ribosome-associated heat shock protein Hsp15
MISLTVRLDKFLWAVRLFKTRALAAEACEGGKVRYGELRVKPSRSVRAGDVICIRTPDLVSQYRVEALCDKRLSASLVQNFLTNITPPEELELCRLRRLQKPPVRDPGTGRPTKKDRRSLDRLTD